GRTRRSFRRQLSRRASMSARVGFSVIRDCIPRNRHYPEVLDLVTRCQHPSLPSREAAMPNEKSPYRSTRLNVEGLEARDVPASFGATRGLSLAVGDVISSNPGDEIITGTGPGRQALVRVWAQSGALLTAFNPFGNFKGGVFVAVGNVNSDNTLELI